MCFRQHSLEKSCDALPTSLVLVKNDEDKNCKSVIGHLKITPIPCMKDSAFVETGKYNFVDNYRIQHILILIFHIFLKKINYGEICLITIIKNKKFN